MTDDHTHSEASAGDSGGVTPTGRRGGRLAWLGGRTGLFLLLILAAYVVPRAALYRGIPIVTNFSFADMIYHVHHLDIETKKLTLPASQTGDRFIRQFPELTTRIHPYRWPGAVYWGAVPFSAAFGAMSIWTIQGFNFACFALLVAGVIGLGRAMGGLRVGLWGGLLTVLCPPLFASTWYYSLDFPLVGVCMVGLYLLVRTEGFTRPAWVVAFALWSGLGIYTKFSYTLYLVAPSVLALGFGLWRGPRLRALGLAALAWVIGAGMFFLAFRPSFEEIWGEFYNHAFSYELPAAAMPPWSGVWWLSQPTFAALNFPYPLLAVPLLGLLAYLVWPRQGRVRWLVLAYFFGSVLLLTFMSNKLERYLHPVYPVLCLLAAWFVLTVLPRKVRTAAATLTALAFGGTLAYLQVDPTPWHTGSDNARASAAMWNEYAMPGLRRLDRQRKDPYLSHCHFKEMVDQVVAWARADRRGRPMGMAHVRSANTGGREIPFGELLLLVAHELPDRFVVAGGLYGMERLPGPLGQAPNLVIVHPPDEDPRNVHPELEVLTQKTFRLQCTKTAPRFTLSLFRHM